MKVIIAVVAALCMIQALDAKVIRDTSAQPQISEAIARAQEVFNNASSHVQHLLGIENVPSQEQVLQVLTNHTQILADKIKEAARQYQQKATEATGEVSTVLNNIVSNLNQTAQSLAAEHPEATRQAQEIQSQLESGYQTLMEQARALGESLQGPASDLHTSLQDITRTTLTQVEALANEVKTQVQQASEHH